MSFHHLSPQAATKVKIMLPFTLNLNNSNNKRKTLNIVSKFPYNIVLRFRTKFRPIVLVIFFFLYHFP